MRVVFLRPAQTELIEAKRFYNRQQHGLGESFKTAAYAAAKRVSERPLAWQVESGSVRRCLLGKFPYKLLYVVRTNEVVILALAHTHRDPDYWLDRLDLL